MEIPQEKSSHVSIREQIATLEELSAIDADMRRIDEELEKQKGGLNDLTGEVKALEDRLKSHRDSLAEMDKTRAELTAELRSMTQQIERSRDKLQRSRNERESNAAQRELEELRKLVRDREEEIERLQSLAEQARASIAEAENRRVELAASLEGTSEGVARTVATLEQEKTERSKRREEVVRRLPPIVYRRYESIRARRPQAIARASDGTCQGCHLAIPPMLFQKMLRQEEFEQCPNCRRILYYMPAGPPNGDAAEAANPSRARA